VTSVDQTVEKLLKDWMPDSTLAPQRESWGERLELPVAKGGEYGFVLYEYKDSAERQVAARRLGASDEEYFWYAALEYGEAHVITEQYRELVTLVLTRPTRIIQRKGLVFWHFRCEALTDGKWKRVSGNSVLKGAGKVPMIAGRRQVYASPALAAASG
jgi:hypothetical protein